MNYTGTQHHTHVLKAGDKTALAATRDILASGSGCHSHRNRIRTCGGCHLRRCPCSHLRDQGGPSFNPLIVHVPDLCRTNWRFFRNRKKLALHFWAGALTLVWPCAVMRNALPSHRWWPQGWIRLLFGYRPPNRPWCFTPFWQTHRRPQCQHIRAPIAHAPNMCWQH